MVLFNKQRIKMRKLYLLFTIVLDQILEDIKSFNKKL